MTKNLGLCPLRDQEIVMDVKKLYELPIYIFKGEVRRKMNFIYACVRFVVLKDVVKVFPVNSPSFARKTTGRNRARSHSGA